MDLWSFWRFTIQASDGIQEEYHHRLFNLSFIHFYLYMAGNTNNICATGTEAHWISALGGDTTEGKTMVWGAWPL